MSVKFIIRLISIFFLISISCQRNRGKDSNPYAQAKSELEKIVPIFNTTYRDFNKYLELIDWENQAKISRSNEKKRVAFLKKIEKLESLNEIAKKKQDSLLDVIRLILKKYIPENERGDIIKPIELRAKTNAVQFNNTLLQIRLKYLNLDN